MIEEQRDVINMLKKAKQQKVIKSIKKQLSKNRNQDKIHKDCPYNVDNRCTWDPYWCKLDAPLGLGNCFIKEEKTELFYLRLQGITAIISLAALTISGIAIATKLLQ